MADYQAVLADVESGTSVKEAVLKHGGSVGSYYAWKSKQKAGKPKTRKPKVTTLELPGLGLSGPSLEIRGEPESLASFLVFLGKKLGGGQ
jgi:hypothetical protein